jgi:excinuclease ABC subunit A
MSDCRAILIRGAREHNLKGIDLDIPLNKFTVITGVSGAGKSSLAFDTLYAEGQRRYVETFSPYARQFLDRLERPKAERIEGIPPGIAIDRKDPVRTSRSTVGTMTEITDYAKLLFAKAGILHCEKCRRPIAQEGPEDVWSAITGPELPKGGELIITFPFDTSGAGLEQLLRIGLTRRLEDWKLLPLDDPDRPCSGITHIVMDRLPAGSWSRKRVVDSLEQAFNHGKGRLDVWIGPGFHRAFSSGLDCPECGISYSRASSNLFSFNNPIGACPRCRGFGRVIEIDMDLVIPNRGLSLAQGAIKPWGGSEERRLEYRDLETFCLAEGIDMTRPYQSLEAHERRAIEDGTSNFYGIKGFFEWLETKTYKMHVRVYLSRYRTYALCPQCLGSRFKKEALLYLIDGLSIADFYALDVTRARAFVEGLQCRDEALALIKAELSSRLRFLHEVGLGYLTLDRQSKTLSGGEVARVAMASALGSSIVDSLYVLDEPSIGLHPRDIGRLIRIIKGLRDLPNTVVVVEHDPSVIASADHVVELGPGAGSEGGSVVYEGSPSGMVDTATGRYLNGFKKIPVPGRRKTSERSLFIRGATAHNLKDITVEIPLGLFVSITGVSGSGKSTLVEEILYRALKRLKGDPQERPGPHRGIDGAEQVADVVLVDQRPIGRTPRANLLTYTGAMPHIRRLFAATPKALELGLTASEFSFNSGSGRCPVCRGQGYQRLEMQFLSDVDVPCPECLGKRFKPFILDVKFKGRNIDEVLSMTADEACAFFSGDKTVARLFETVRAVGLGYMTLGQPLNTLSGGEAQRLKLSRHLAPGDKGGLLFIFDEPTTGLHLQDTALLLEALFALRDRGNTVLVVEHNMEVVKASDWVIDLGPEGGESGGYVTAFGTPEEVAQSQASPTAPFLKKALEQAGWKHGSSEVKEEQGAWAKEGGTGPEMINITGAREHNLKDLSLSIPRKKLVVITGVSGSGKSSIAFDILFAEGQRRYLETLAPYVRQYMRILQRPDVDSVAGIPPTVAIEQRISHAGRRSTVATMTEIYHFMRLLFSKLGTPHCPQCGAALSAGDPDTVAALILERHADSGAMILAPKALGRKGFHKKVLSDASLRGFTEARIDGVLSLITKGMVLERYREHAIELVIGRLSGAGDGNLIRKAMEEGGGTVIVARPGEGDITYSASSVCPRCGIGAPEPDPRLFSFNSGRGACRMCGGTGTVGEDGDRVCPSCMGARLGKEALSFRINGFSIWDLVSLPAAALMDRLKGLRFEDVTARIAEPLLAQILERLRLMERLGIGYLELSRSGDTLSGGEAQRIRLAAQLGSNLTGACYVLDEPTIGLHPADAGSMIGALRELRDKGNSVIVVEHDLETIRSADHIIDIGPGAGEEGGRLVAQGPPALIGNSPDSITGLYINGKYKPSRQRPRPYRGRPSISIKGAFLHNLRDVDVDIPLGCLVCVTGVSGSGKSTLLKDVLYDNVSALLSGSSNGLKGCRGIAGWQNIRRILEVDHSPIGRTARSVPATYVGILTHIRRLFSLTPEARARGYGPGRFSFNNEEGRCGTCKGHGSIKVSMGFLPDVYVRCESCEGRRFNTDTLEIRYKGKNMADVMDMTFEECAAFFANIPEIGRCASLVSSIGLGYLRLGQPTPTLSGGEAQRIKLSEELSKKTGGQTFYVLDEPTTGLHMADTERLIQLLQALVDRGNTVATIEHNLAVIEASDYIIDLGPEGGSAGGTVVAMGSPEEVARMHHVSQTARYLSSLESRD